MGHVNCYIYCKYSFVPSVHEHYIRSVEIIIIIIIKYQ